MPLPQILTRQVSDLDRAETRYYPDGRREIVFPDPNEAERLRLHREAAEAAEVERLAHEVRDRKIGARVRDFLAASEPAADLTARERLLHHLDLTERARRSAAAVHARAAEIAELVARVAALQHDIQAIDDAVADAFGSWLAFGSEGTPPPNRADEREALTIRLAEAGTLAQHADAAEFEADVGRAIVEALEGRTRAMRCAVLIEEAAAPTEARIQTLTDELGRLYGSLAALGAVVRGAGRYGPSDCRIDPPRPQTAKLPPTLRAEGRPIEMPIAATPTDLALWQAGLEALVADPLAAVTPPFARQERPDGPQRPKRFWRT